jgi:hypothetical protein
LKNSFSSSIPNYHEITKFIDHLIYISNLKFSNRTTNSFTQNVTSENSQNETLISSSIKTDFNFKTKNQSSVIEKQSLLL